MMKTTRQRLLDYIQIKKVATPADISRALKMSAANARHHLAILISEGAVELVGQRPARTRGRPSLLYGVTRQVLQHNLDGLSNALLQDALTGTPPEKQTDLLRRLAAHISGEHESVQGNLTQRLTHGVNHLNTMNYLARWEARANAPRIVFNHCPYAAILPEHPELCQLDAFLLERLTGLSATQTARLERTPQGLTQCAFLLKG